MSEVTGGSSRQWRRALVLGAIVLGGALLARSLDLQAVLRLENVAHLKIWIEQLGPTAPLVFITVYILAVPFFVPGLPMTVAGGLLFGPLWGTVYASLASTIGAALAFLVARYGAREMVERWVQGNPRMVKMDQAIARHGWRVVMITRLVPLFPFNLQNYAYGLTRVSFWTYLVTSWLCMLPATVVFTVAGGAFSEGAGDLRRTLAYLGVAGILLAVLSLIPRWVTPRSRMADELLAQR